MKKVFGWMAVLSAVVVLAGCGGSKIDENKPMDQVAADAAKLGQAELQKMVEQYEALIAEKGQELAALKDQVKEIPITEMMGEKAKSLKEEAAKITESMGKLKDQMAVYAKELAAKK